ncbi:RIP metalloprotease RseP [Fundicoccus culcitae]|uniref:Zinc metalloprotease n=1 Tax=Fundicoccus culcitae TaxID=2969821 RepID=A0ABY5P7C6_9LACT|nr:RIP metalloprotease RseP [Fundicoccus culcitae]UUX34637.1 RIP metalloprotease RseP [Fundicoccus culcitae]
MQTLIVFLIVFSIIVVFHEFGHFYFARRAGILVREFSLGMGPKLFARQGKDGTTYTVRMLPLGGYVRLAGLNEEDNVHPGMEVGLTFNDANQVSMINTSDKPELNEMPAQVDEVDLAENMTIRVYQTGHEEAQTFDVSKECRIIEEDGTNVKVAPIESRYESASVWNKLLTNFAGPMNNFILSIVCFILFAFLVPGIPSNSSTIGTVVEDSPAQVAGLEDGDQVIAINYNAVDTWTDLQQYIASSPGEELVFSVERDNQVIELPVQVNTVTNEDGTTIGQIGVSVAMKTGVLDRIMYGFSETWRIITSILSVLVGMIKNGFDINQFGGPIAMAQMTNEVVDYGFTVIISFLAMLSANIGLLNLLPIPALDGGKIILNLIEAIRGKPLAQEKEGIITLIGVGIMFVFMIAVTWNDIMRAFF